MLRFFIFGVIYLSTINSQGYYRGDSLVKQGVDAFYNYEFDRSIEILNHARDQYPDHPGVHLIWAASRWVRSQANDSIQQTYRLLENDLSTIEPIYEELVLKNANDPFYKLYYGSAIGLRARVSMGKKEWLKTLYHSYRGFSTIENVSNAFPEIIDAQLPIGIVEYYAGISNTLLRWTINMMGLDPSMESGLKKITQAANNGKWSWIEAKSILCNLYLWVEDDPVLSLPHARELVYNFPKNYWFNLLYLESLIRTNRIDESYELLGNMDNLLKNLTERQKIWYEPYQSYEKALLFFYQKNYEKTLEFVSETIDNYSGELDIILGNAFLLQGMAYDKVNKRTEARESYNNCLDLDNFSFAMIKAKKYLELPYSEI
tara:strand:+ start:642 stop:1763 length:1122 start_codon:yes stop_codon:yes gene_type:complete